MRHIDADKLYKETKTKIKMENSQGLAVMDDEFLDLIDAAPTEDVVSKAIVCQIFEDIFLCEYYENGNPVVSYNDIVKIKNKFQRRLNL